MHCKNGVANSRELLQCREQSRTGSAVGIGEGFIEEEQFSIGGKRTCNKNALLLAAREGTDLRVCNVGERDRLQCTHRGVAAITANTSEDARLSRETHCGDVEGARGEVPINLRALRNESDARARGIE